MPTATSLHGAAVVDGKIYIIGGTDDLYGWASYWGTVFAYDPETATWARKADMPTGRARLATAVVDDKIYVIGGAPHRDADIATVEMYDPRADVWTRKADLPRARNWFSASAVDGKIYAIGGKIYPSETMVATLEVYDPSTDTWTRKADMPTARGMHTSSVVDGKIYVVGGCTGAYGPWISTVEAYDPATDTWIRRADMPSLRAGHSAAVLCSKIFAVGGASSWSSVYSSMVVYDPPSDTWTSGPAMPTAKLCHSVSAVDGKIYVIGGSLNLSVWSPTPVVEVYDPAPPPPDYNGDGRVDGKDLLIMTAHWGQAYPLCDLGPLPFGDGMVDLEDVIVLADYIGKDIHDPTLIAHWALDETEGVTAGESVTGNDATLTGEPVWWPEAGVLDGALEFDGATFAIADFVLDPADGPFSVLLWVKGGAPGQVLIAQTDGDNWLAIDSVQGTLMTELSPTATRKPVPPLVSDALITDGDWHRVGFVWDGMTRALYVDDALVAEDMQLGMPSYAGGLNIGCDKDMASNTFFTGLIDDVRIYSRAIRP
jgi:N-acetylneuraminic acid mutarotase